MWALFQWKNSKPVQKNSAGVRIWWAPNALHPSTTLALHPLYTFISPFSGYRQRLFDPSPGFHGINFLCCCHFTGADSCSAVLQCTCPELYCPEYLYSINFQYTMPYITLESHLPGITGLLEYRKKDAAQPIRELTQFRSALFFFIGRGKRTHCFRSKFG